jgi:serine/threonine protein kinase
LLLHSCGIVHGDVKPGNVLVFNIQGSYRAKVADFSHSAFDKGASRQLLPGGTAKYAAPEWRDWMTFDDLKRTDMYSFGLVFASILIGHDVFTHADLVDLNSRKRNDTLLRDLRRQIPSLRDPNLDDEPLLYDILGFTVQKARENQDLGRVLERLQKGYVSRRHLSMYSNLPTKPRPFFLTLNLKYQRTPKPLSEAPFDHCSRPIRVS